MISRAFVSVLRLICTCLPLVRVRLTIWKSGNAGRLHYCDEMIAATLLGLMWWIIKDMHVWYFMVITHNIKLSGAMYKSRSSPLHLKPYLHEQESSLPTALLVLSSKESMTVDLQVGVTFLRYRGWFPYFQFNPKRFHGDSRYNNVSLAFVVNKNRYWGSNSFLEPFQSKVQLHFWRKIHKRWWTIPNTTKYHSIILVTKACSNILRLKVQEILWSKYNNILFCGIWNDSISLMDLTLKVQLEFMLMWFHWTIGIPN